MFNGRRTSLKNIVYVLNFGYLRTYSKTCSNLNLSFVNSSKGFADFFAYKFGKRCLFRRSLAFNLNETLNLLIILTKNVDYLSNNFGVAEPSGALMVFVDFTDSIKNLSLFSFFDVLPVAHIFFL